MNKEISSAAAPCCGPGGCTPGSRGGISGDDVQARGGAASPDDADAHGKATGPNETQPAAEDREPDPQDTPRVANPLDVARFTFLSFFAALAPGACGSWRCT